MGDDWACQCFVSHCKINQKYTPSRRDPLLLSQHHKIEAAAYLKYLAAHSYTQKLSLSPSSCSTKRASRKIFGGTHRVLAVTRDGASCSAWKRREARASASRPSSPPALGRTGSGTGTAATPGTSLPTCTYTHLSAKNWHYSWRMKFALRIFII